MVAYTDGHLQDLLKGAACNCIDADRVYIATLSDSYCYLIHKVKLLYYKHSNTDPTCHVQSVAQQVCVGIVAWGWHGRKQRPYVFSKVILLQGGTRQ